MNREKKVVKISRLGIGALAIIFTCSSHLKIEVALPIHSRFGKHYIPLILHKLTHPRTSPCSQEDIGIVILIMIPHDLANSSGCLSTMIKWNTGAVMVRDVGLSINIVRR